MHLNSFLFGLIAWGVFALLAAEIRHAVRKHRALKLYRSRRYQH